jgi:hypothetical protein
MEDVRVATVHKGGKLVGEKSEQVTCTEKLRERRMESNWGAQERDFSSVGPRYRT